MAYSTFADISSELSIESTSVERQSDESDVLDNTEGVVDDMDDNQTNGENNGILFVKISLK